MKTKILLTLSLSLFCINGLARKPKPPTPEILKPQTRGANTNPAFKTPIPLNSARGCNGNCVTAAKEALSTKGVRMLNETPFAEKGVFMLELPPVYGALVNHHNNSKGTLSIKEAFSQAVSANKKALNGTTALAAALQKSTNNAWPQPAKDNLANFIKNLADGVNQKEAEKLKQVEKNCI